MENSKLTTDQKIEAVSKSAEVANCTKILYALFQDCKLSSFVRYDIVIEGKEFELTFQQKTTHYK